MRKENFSIIKLSWATLIKVSQARLYKHKMFVRFGAGTLDRVGKR